MYIDAPVEQNSFPGALTDAGDDPFHDEDAIIDSKTLYKNFMALVEEGHAIKINKKWM